LRFAEEDHEHRDAARIFGQALVGAWKASGCGPGVLAVGEATTEYW
jgi:hypothetical protein